MSNLISLMEGKSLPSVDEVMEEVNIELSTGKYDSCIVILTGPRDKFVNSSNHTQSSYLFVLEMEKAEHIDRLLHD